MRKLFFAAALFFAASTINAHAAEHWIHLATPHFEMYTTSSEKQATEALRIFEQVRYFFLQNSRSKTLPDARVRIIAFRSEKEFKPYRINEASPAYYLRSRKVDYIVMQDITPAHYQAAFHEYTHLVVEHLGLKLPLCLNEGLADLYSSLEPRGDKAMVGRPLEGRSYSLLNQPWLDLPALFAVGHDSPYYNEAQKMSVFYAESWALTHMLALGKNYISKFPSFLVAVSSGRPIEECFQSIYGKSLAQVQKDLHAYVTQSSVSAALFDVKLGKSDLEPEVSNPLDLEVDLALANLLASQTRTMAEAADRLSKLSQEHPESAEVQESLGYLQWAQGNVQQAVQSFHNAADRGSNNAEMFFHYSQLSMQTGATAAQVIPILQRAVELKPDYQDAWFNLGMYSTNAARFGVAIDAFNHIKNVTEEHAGSFFSARAYCYFRLNVRDAARENAEQARKYAKTPQEQQQAASLLRALDDSTHAAAAQPAAASTEASEPAADMMSEKRPILRRVTPDGNEIHLQHVDGIARSFDCAAKPARLHVTVAGKEMIFAMDDPDSIVVRNSKTGFAEFQCGAQKPLKIGIFYAASSSADGSIRELVF